MIDKKTTSVLFTILVFASVLAVIYEARRPLVILIFSVLFAHLLEPFVTWFQNRLRGSRTTGIAATYLTLAIIISAFFALAGPKIVQQSTVLGREFPTLMEKVGSGDIAQQIGTRQHWSYETKVRIQAFLRDHRESITRVMQGAVNRVPALAANSLWLLLIPLFAVFILKSKTQFATALVSFMEQRHDRRFLRAVLNDLDVMLAAFIRAQLSLAALSLVAYTLVLVVARFPFSFAIGAIGGVLEFIPLVGALASGVLIMGIALVTGYPHWLPILIFLLVWRGMQDYLNSPLLMARGMKLHPFAVILGVMVLGEVAGIFGVFLSVPIMASLRIIWKNWRLRENAIEIKARSESGAETAPVLASDFVGEETPSHSP
jgi:predicted PurR-regulated permease PerM